MYGAPKAVLGEAKEAAQAPYRAQRGLIAKHASAALRVMQGMENVDATRIAAVGYCFGGKVVLDLARAGAQLKLVVSFHGLLDRLNDPVGGSCEVEAAAATVKPKIVAFHGYADSFTNPRNLNQFMRELEDMEAEYEVRVCGSGVVHGFMRPGTAVKCMEGEADGRRPRMEHHPHVAKETWTATLELLREHLA